MVNQVSLEERPAVVDQKSRVGDWKFDTIIGKRHRQAIGSMTERKSKLLTIRKISRKTLGYQTPLEVYIKEQEQLRKVALTT